MADPIGDYVVAAKDYRRKQSLDSYFASHPSGMPTEGDVQTPGLTQQPQASAQGDHAAITPKGQQAKPRGERTVGMGQPRDLQGEVDAATNADATRQGNAEKLQADLQAKDDASQWKGREWVQPTNDPVQALFNAAEQVGAPGRLAILKAAGKPVEDPSKIDTAVFLKKLGIPTPGEINDSAPFANVAKVMAMIGGLGIAGVADPTNYIPGGGAAKAGKLAKDARNISKTGSLKDLGKFAAQPLPQYVPPPAPAKGLNPESVAADAHSAFQQGGSDGVTWNPSRGNMEGQPGYAVAIAPEVTKTIPGTPTQADFHQFVQENAELLKQHPDLSIGAWKDGDNTVLDLSAVVPDMQNARQLGFMTGQKAIYDLASGQDIPLEGMELTHYGKMGQPLEGGMINPAKQGTGQGGGELFRKANYGDDFVERSFFYKKGTRPEHRFLGHPKYNVTVDPERIYDMDADPMGLNKSIRDYTLREKHIKEAGYLGYTDPASYAGDKTMSRIVQLFEPVRPRETGLPELDARLAFLQETQPKDLFKQPGFANEPAATLDTQAGRTVTGHPYERPSEFTDDDHIMAQIYDAAESHPEDPKVQAAWGALKNETDKLYNDIIKKVQVEKVTGQPYANSEEMIADIKSGHFKVTTDNSTHPLWNEEENWKFRVVHDYVAHFESKNDFSMAGEAAAYKYHASILRDQAAKDALRVEVHGQAASAIGHGGEFPEQKVFIPDFEEHAKRTGEQFQDIGVGLPPETVGPKTRGVFNNVVENAAAAVIHRGAKNLDQLKAGMEETGLVRAAGAEINWNKLWEKAKKTYKSYVDALKGKDSKLAPLYELTEKFNQGEYLKFWYNDARDMTAEAIGVGIDTETQLPNNILFLKMVAATSPMNAVEKNINDALTAYKNYKTGEPWDASLSFYKRNLDRIVANRDFGYDAGGPKVTEFFHALVGDPDAVVIDRHMMGAFGFQKTVVKDGIESTQYAASEKQIGFMQQLIKQEAARFKVTPREYQAAVWVGHKLQKGLEEGEILDTFGRMAKAAIEKDPYFKYPPGMGEAGKANFAAMWMLTRMTAGAMFGGEYGDTTSDRLLNAAAGAGLSLAMFSPKTISKLTGIMMKSEAAINAERAASRTETVFKLSNTGDKVTVNIGGQEASFSASSLQTHGGVEAAVEQVKKARKDYAKEAAQRADAPTVNREGSRGVITNDEARRLGALLGLDAETIMARAAGDAHAAEEIFAYADILDGTWNHLVQLGAEVERDPANPANASALMMLEPIYRSVGNQFRGALEEAGRSLQAAGAKDVQRAKSNLELFEGGCL